MDLLGAWAAPGSTHFPSFNLKREPVNKTTLKLVLLAIFSLASVASPDCDAGGCSRAVLQSGSRDQNLRPPPPPSSLKQPQYTVRKIA